MSIEYSKKYSDDTHEYRHVILPSSVAKKLPDPQRLLTEAEWRALGVQQSLGWVHYDFFKPEPHILLFRRPLPIPNVVPQQPAATPMGSAIAPQFPKAPVKQHAN